MREINGILLLYRYPFTADVKAITEYVNAFGKHSRFKVWAINANDGFPKELTTLHFKIIVFHYSFFFSYSLKQFREYLEESRESYKVAIFQDEHHGCIERFAFINHFQIDCIFTLIESQYFKDTYEKFTHVSKIINCIPGYVSEDLVLTAEQFALPEEQRAIDIGYRGRPAPYSWGKGAQEKNEIGQKFLMRAKSLDLRLDIETRENQRIYGSAWHHFLANCRGVLAVEAGVSIFDIDGTLYRKYQKFMKCSDYDQIIDMQSTISFEEVSKKLNFDLYEGKINYRTISPRHFEAAAFRVCQILYEGDYSGILKPMVHYIPLKKDFSNFDEVIIRFCDPQIRYRLTENAYNDLIASGDYSNKKFINLFDNTLIEAGLNPHIDEETVENVSFLLKKGTIRRFHITRLKNVLKIFLLKIFHTFPKRIQWVLKRDLYRLKINLVEF